MARMITTRGYWVDWICAFDKTPSSNDIKKGQNKVTGYVQKYLENITAKSKSPEIKTVFDEKIEEWNNIKLMWGPIYSKGAKRRSVKKGVSTNWKNALKWEWDRISSKPVVFNFKAYFEIKAKRYTGELKGTMTPPPPPPPPGSGTA